MSESNIPNLKVLRLAHKVTQDQLATALKVNARTIIRWEAGDQDPNLSDLRRIAAFFEISVAELIGDDPLDD